MIWTCQNCHNDFEWHRRGEPTHPAKCPKCGDTKVEPREM